MPPLITKRYADQDSRVQISFAAQEATIEILRSAPARAETAFSEPVAEVV